MIKEYTYNQKAIHSSIEAYNKISRADFLNKAIYADSYKIKLIQNLINSAEDQLIGK